ncbi:GntR family transcriptional regulator [Martelella endophytica]|uniref:GntR family transcriptional regulator n=1 Tax=Martelella endophytica TaxID=1486262 RepID=A0A0D5LRF4_MAREN|nr:GntR family transcriptional regulator [Martelella endophytica]AJY45903.1 GntR family transcriptional regulator [Martelella endophytica]
MTQSKTNEETLSERIARVLADRIISGVIGPGARLRQDHVAAEFGASHVPVREAFRALQTQGLAENEPWRGFRVTEFDIAELREVAEMRASLESLALRHAAPNLTRSILQQAEAVSRSGERAGNVRDWEAANRRFHSLILAPCGMPRLLRTIDDLQAASARFLFAAWRSDWEARTDHDHRAILTALREGQTEFACSTLARHVGWIGKRKPASKNADLRDTYEIPG